jgi:hypothetical protein
MKSYVPRAIAVWTSSVAHCGACRRTVNAVPERRAFQHRSVPIAAC